MERGILRVGPAGWSYDDWKGIVYPQPMPRGKHPLDILIQWFDTIEINSSYYRPLSTDHARAWVARASANPQFRFTAKLWRRFTHDRDHFPDRAELAQVRQGFAPLVDAGILGAVLVQFPWSFKRTPQNRVWMARVFDGFADYPLVLEVRHASWDCQEVYDGLRDRGIAFCNIDQPLFNNSIAPRASVTAALGYVRLHGRNHDDWFRETATRDERYDYLYSEDELKPWLEKLNRIQETAAEVYAITNNHYRGQAVVNAFEMQAALGLRRVEIPDRLLGHFPRLKTVSA